MRYAVSPPESVLAMASTGGTSFEKSSGFVTSMTTLPAKFFSPAILIALGVPSHSVAITTISPNAAASAKLPAVVLLRCFAAHDATFSWLRVPILIVCPVAIKPSASRCPTSPDPRNTNLHDVVMTLCVLIIKLRAFTSILPLFSQ
jgi:hypothetical protein